MPGVGSHILPSGFFDRIVEVRFEIGDGKTGEVLYFSRQRQLPHRQRSLQAVVFGHCPFEDKRFQVRTRRINRRCPRRRS